MRLLEARRLLLSRSASVEQTAFELRLGVGNHLEIVSTPNLSSAKDRDP
ncbi:hypothetical protein [Paraburkholderia ferrariae]|nr:hypothetical protein [Paraburkholderia ferrariae]